ncbi:MAG: PIG-L deacetylase family protein [Acidimicrobiales bacterium]
MVEMLHDAPSRVLAIYAHPDDPDVGCGGTLAAWAARGSEIHVLLCTDGDKGSVDTLAEPTVLALERAREAAASAGLIGLARQEFLHYPDGELQDDAVFRRKLVSAVRRIRPEVVLCPDPTAIFFGQEYFNHRDHRITGWAALDAIAPASALPLYFPDAGPPHQVSTVLLSGTLDPDVWVDISATVDVKAKAVGCHRSQFPDGAEWAKAAVRSAAEDAGRSAGVAFAEGFRRLRLSG